MMLPETVHITRKDRQFGANDIARISFSDLRIIHSTKVLRGYCNEDAIYPLEESRSDDSRSGVALDMVHPDLRVNPPSLNP